MLHVIDRIAAMKYRVKFFPEIDQFGDRVCRLPIEGDGTDDTIDLLRALECKHRLSHARTIERSANSDHRVGSKSFLGFETINIENFIVVEECQMNRLATLLIELFQQRCSDLYDVELRLCLVPRSAPRNVQLEAW